MTEDFKYEFWKFTGIKYRGIRGRLKLKTSHTLKYLYYGRKEQYSKGVFRKYYQLRKKYIGIRTGIEIPDFRNIKPGLLLCHAFDITVNENAVLGKDVTLFKGATIGSIRTGKRAGAPVIGDRVVIGANAFVGGGITIGSDVMIAPGAFVNFDVPDHSVVIGNPGVIHRKERAADDYFTSFSPGREAAAYEGE